MNSDQHERGDADERGRVPRDPSIARPRSSRRHRCANTRHGRLILDLVATDGVGGNLE